MFIGKTRCHASMAGMYLHVRQGERNQSNMAYVRPADLTGRTLAHRSTLSKTPALVRPMVLLGQLPRMVALHL